MPRDHGRILSTIWQDRDFRQRSPEAQRLYMLLLSQPNVNNAGVLPLQVTKWARGCSHTSPEDVQKALDELSEHRYVMYDEDTEEALVRSYMRNDGVMRHPNLVKNALRCAEATESQELRDVLANELRRTRRSDATETANRISPPKANPSPSESDPKPVVIPSESHQDPESHPDPISILAGRGYREGEGETPVVGSVGEEPPPENCPKHRDNPDPPACGACGSYNRRRNAWFDQQATRKAERLADFWAEVRAAECCDDHGRIDAEIGNHLVRCPNHDWSVIDDA